MVKGVSRRVVVVKSPDPKWFEQAIFLLREEAGAEDAPEEQVLKRAQEVADAYLLRTSPQGKRRRISDSRGLRPGGRWSRLGHLAVCHWGFSSSLLIPPVVYSGYLQKQKGRERHAQRHSHRHARCGQEHPGGAAGQNPGHDLS